MKTRFTGCILALLAVCFSLTATGQTNNRFYASIEDLVNDKPMPGIEIVENSWGETMGVESFKISTNGKTERVRISKLPSEFFTYKDFVIRAYDSDAYIVLTAGKYCLYSAYTAQAALYTSETLSGKLNKFDEKGFKKHLAQYGLLDAYMKDKPKPAKGDTDNSFFNKKLAWQIKYFKLLNEKVQS